MGSKNTWKGGLSESGWELEEALGAGMPKSRIIEGKHIGEDKNSGMTTEKGREDSRKVAQGRVSPHSHQTR